MPKLNGFDLLQWLRGKQKYWETPVFMLSSSGLEQDVLRAKALGADQFFVKTPFFNEVIAALQERVNTATGRSRPLEQEHRVRATLPRRVGPEPDLVKYAREMLFEAESLRLNLQQNRLRSQMFRARAETLIASMHYRKCPRQTSENN